MKNISILFKIRKFYNYLILWIKDIHVTSILQSFDLSYTKVNCSKYNLNRQGYLVLQFGKRMYIFDYVHKSSRMKKADLSKEDKLVSSILKEARELFSRYGFKKTSMDDVAKAVGKGKSTLYYYFPGKTELFGEVVEEEGRQLIKAIRQAINEQSSAEAKLQAYLMARMRLRRDFHTLSKVILEDIVDRYGDFLLLREEFERVQVEFIKEIIVSGIQLGEFKKMSEDDVLFVASWISAAFSGLELPSEMVIDLTKSQESCNRIVKLILGGIQWGS